MSSIGGEGSVEWISMSPAEANQAKRFPLQVTIAFVFSLLFLLVGLALISYNYVESRKMAMLGAKQARGFMP